MVLSQGNLRSINGHKKYLQLSFKCLFEYNIEIFNHSPEIERFKISSKYDEASIKISPSQPQTTFVPKL